MSLDIIDKALRESQRGFDPVMMAAAVFDALDIDPEAEMAHNIRRIIQRNLMDTNFNRMAEEVTAAIQEVAA
jgi:predicted YcjX-like family ATPase